MPRLCRDCEFWFDVGSRCPSCRSPRIVAHDELRELSIAHMDCDAFYASIEKRDNPNIRDQPVIVGGRKRGVVATACYIARIYGVHSAMPMFQALKLCPDAVVVPPRMQVYTEVSKRIREMMLEFTPDVEPLSLDEAFLNLSGTAKLHGAPAATLMVRLTNRMESELGLTGSIGLSHNKFLAKVASDLEKPCGFSIIGKDETADFLRDKPVGLIWGVGAVMQAKLRTAGILTFGDLLNWNRDQLKTQFGEIGTRLWKIAHGKDARKVDRRRPVKSVSNETTFDKDISEPKELDGHLWRLSVKVADRLKTKGLHGRVVTLKLKQRNFKTITRRRTLEIPTNLSDRLYRNSRKLLDGELKRAPFRLIGVGLSDLHAVPNNFDEAELSPEEARHVAAETAFDSLRNKFGKDIIFKGRSLD